MGVRRVYQCAQCHHVSEMVEPIADAPLSVCPRSDCRAPSLRQVYTAPAPPLVRGAPVRATPFRRSFVGREPDGRETSYATLEAAQRGERERAEGAFGGTLPSWAQQRLADHNVKHIRKTGGLVEGTEAAAYCAAIEERT
mgnify:FL=1